MKKLIAAAALALATTCFAAPQASAADDGIKIFRDVYMPAMEQQSNYEVDFMFNGPTFHSNAVTYWTLTGNNAAQMDGKFVWDYTNLRTNQTSKHEIPVYGEKSGNGFDLYGKSETKWEHENLFVGLTGLLNAFQSNDLKIKEDIASAVKRVRVSDAGTDNRRMDIRLDGQALAKIEKDIVGKHLDSLSADDKALAVKDMNYVATALAEEDLNVIWTVKKSTGETVTLAADLTDFMRNYAKAVLEDSYKGNITLTPEEKEYLASIGYYYNLQCYINKVKDKRGALTVPADLDKNLRTQNLFQYIEGEIVSVVK